MWWCKYLQFSFFFSYTFFYIVVEGGGVVRVSYYTQIFKLENNYH